MKSLEEQYTELFHNCKNNIEEPLNEYLHNIFSDVKRIDKLSVRTKSIEQFIKKANKKVDENQKYSDPLSQIQDIIGARIVVFYSSDVDIVSKFIEKYFRKIELINFIPDSEDEFGYFGKHYTLFIPDDIFSSTEDQKNYPKFFELQIKTLFQHAWSEANHDICYKPQRVLTTTEKRKVAFTSAQAWGADLIFDELHKSSN